MLRAVPAMTRNAASSEFAFKSFAFIFTMSKTCLRVTLPTFSLFGSLEPAVMPAAFFKRMDAGGDLVIAIDGHPVMQYDDLIAYLIENKSPGDKVVLTVLRGTQKLDITITLGKRP